MTGFASIEAAIEEIRAGRILVVVDDEDRENEGDLVMAADKVTPEAVNFMAKYGRGLICVPMTGERLDELKISMMVSDNTAPMATAFTVTVDARRGVTTGTSAYDRAVTIRTLVDPAMGRRDLTAPGHIFPLRAMPGGVLRRAGHTQEAVDPPRLPGGYPPRGLFGVVRAGGAVSSAPAAATADRSSRRRSESSGTKARASWCTCDKKAAGSDSSTRCARTSYRIKAWIRSRRTLRWGSHPIRATTASGRRFSS